jgi:hypothetical protein
MVDEARGFFTLQRIMVAGCMLRGLFAQEFD